MKKALRRSNRKGFYYKRRALAVFSPLSLAPLAWWRLDDGSGTTPQDSSGNGHHGTLSGDAAWAAGLVGGGISFNSTGTDGQIATPLDVEVTAATFVALLNPSVSQNDFTGLLMSRGTSVSGMMYGGGDNELGYNWNDDGNAWGWNSGLVVPTGEWSLAVVAVEAAKATAYLGTGSGLQTAVNNVVHAATTLDDLRMATDDGASNQAYKGLFDEPMLFDRALTAEEVAQIFAWSGI